MYSAAPCVGAVDHVLVHQVNLAVVPCPAGAGAIADSVGQEDPVSQDVVCAEVSLDSGQSVGQAGGLHLAAVVGASRGVGVVHNVVVEGPVGNDQHMVGGQLGVAAVQAVVSMGGPVFAAVDGPVAASAQMDFVKVAEGMGAKAYRITKKEDVEPVLREAISLNIPVMIECQIGSDDKVFPMVPAGKPIEEAFDEIDLRIE